MPHASPKPSDLPRSATHNRRQSKKHRPKPAHITVVSASQPRPGAGPSVGPVPNGGPGTPYPHFRPSAPAAMILSPRPFEDLYNERTYLLSCLQSHEAAVGGLARRYSTIEQRLARASLNDGPADSSSSRSSSSSSGPSSPDGIRKDGEEAALAAKTHEARESRRLLQSLRGRIAAKAEQQKAIMARLGELHVEIQSRTAAGQAQLGEWPPSPGTTSMGAVSAQQSLRGFFYGPVSLPTTPISPMTMLPSPYTAGTFADRTFADPALGWCSYDPWGRQSSAHHQTGPMVRMPPLAEQEAACEHRDEHQYQNHQRPLLGHGHDGAHQDDDYHHKQWPSRRASTGNNTAYAPRARDQRNSLPTTAGGVWPE